MAEAAAAQTAARRPATLRRLAWLEAAPYRRWSVALAAGAVAALAFPPAELIPMMAVGLCALLWLTDRSGRWQDAFLLGWWFGLGHFAAGFYWIVESFRNQPAAPDALGPPAVLALSALMAVYPAAAGALTRAVGRRRVAGVLVFAVAWAGTEWLRGHLLTGFPWNPLSAIWAGWPMMMQPLAWLGTYGVSFFTALVMAAPLLLVPPFGCVRQWPWAAGAAGLLALWAAAGAWRLDAIPPAAGEGPMIRLVQANIPQREKWRDGRARAHFAQYMTMSEMLAPPDDRRLLVVWPETAVTDYYFDRRYARRTLAARVLPPGGLLVTGAPRVIEDERGGVALANSLLAIDHTGRLRALYDKHHLVPFGEYLPFRSLLSRIGLDKLTPGGADFRAGEGPRSLAIDGFPPFSPLICYEAIFPGAVAPKGAARPAFLLNITNDAWFGDGSGPYQHFAMARMRAVEEGLPLVRAAQTGISAVIDPLGRVVVRIGLLRRGTADAVLPDSLVAPTAYARWGDGIFAFILLFAVAITIFSHRTRRQRS